MKKLLLILICVLVVAVCVPTFVVAETSSATTTETVANDVHFIAPTGIALVGDYLLVSDNVADNQSAILCFDIANGNAHKFTQIIDKEIVSLSSSNGRLFAIFADSFVEYKIAEDVKSVEVVEPFAFENVIDVCVGKLTDDNGTKETIYFLQKGTAGDSLRRVKDDKTAGTINGMTVATAYNCISFSNEANTNNYVYIAGKKADGTNSITRFACNFDTDIDEDNLNHNGVQYVENFTLLGIVANNRDYPAVFGSKSIYNVNPDGDVAFVATNAFVDFDAQEHKFIKVVSSKNHLAILNENNQIQIYPFEGTGLNVANISEIGSDQVSTAVPTTFTGFTLAKSTGYPTNIVYKTKDNKTSVESILTKGDVGEFVILNYDGCENSSYYYVFVSGRFGWIKKSDSATITNGTIEDEKIAVISTKVSDKVTYNAKFNTLGKVYVYDLPSSNDGIRKLLQEVSQTGSKMNDVTILQHFREGDVVWYYVEYGTDRARGFVKSSDVGQFTATLVTPVDAVLDKQINASLFNAVTLHMTNDLSPDTVFTYDGKNPVKLYSGDWVKLIEVDDETGASLVQVVAQDGTTTYGWVESSRLIETDQITTNAVVGLSAFGFAILLAIVFMTVFIKRRKKIK